MPTCYHPGGLPGFCNQEDLHYYQHLCLLAELQRLQQMGEGDFMFLVLLCLDKVIG